MRTLWHNRSGAFLLFSHETSPPAASSVGVTVWASAQSLTTASAMAPEGSPGSLPQFPPLSSCPPSGGLPIQQLQRDPHILGWLGAFTLPYPAFAKSPLLSRHLCASHVADWPGTTDTTSCSSPLSGRCPRRDEFSRARCCRNKISHPTGSGTAMISLVISAAPAAHWHAHW